MFTVDIERLPLFPVAKGDSSDKLAFLMLPRDPFMSGASNGILILDADYIFQITQVRKHFLQVGSSNRPRRPFFILDNISNPWPNAFLPLDIPKCSCFGGISQYFIRVRHVMIPIVDRPHNIVVYLIIAMLISPFTLTCSEMLTRGYSARECRTDGLAAEDDIPCSVFGDIIVHSVDDIQRELFSERIVRSEHSQEISTINKAVVIDIVAFENSLPAFIRFSPGKS